jgi:hypothetical protein
MRLAGSCSRTTERPMLDAILLAAGLGFFFATVAYAAACDML